MSWYLTITPPAGQAQIADTRKVVELLSSIPELHQTGPMTFGTVAGQPWMSVILAKRNRTGGYSTDGASLGSIDIVELVCSHTGDTAWYDSLAVRIAASLGWIAVEEHEDRLVWPLP
jgi:hypothetical protein